MTFEEILNEAVAMLRRQGRVSYRALRRQFELDDPYLDDLKHEMLYTQSSRVIEDGDHGLIWTGEPDVTSPGASSPEATERAPLTHTPQHLTEKILTARSSVEGERKQVTVLFADIKGSTELIDGLDPEAARNLLDPALHLMMAAVHRYEGTVNQVLGDGIMSLFGAPLAHEDHAARACYAALTMQAAMRDYAHEVLCAHGIKLQIRVGLNSGEVVVRTISSDLHMDYSAVGQTTHLAARMEQLAPADRICLPATTLRLAEGLIQVESLGPQEVKGLMEPLEVFVLTGVTAARTRWEATLGRGLTQFVGRESALHTLEQALTHARGGHGQLVAVVGEPGIGKSRLVHEFTQSPATRDCLVMTSSSVSYGKATTWLPVIDLLKRYFQIEDRDEAPRIAYKVSAKLETLDSSLSPTKSAFLSLFDVPIDDAEWQSLGAMQQRRRLLNAIQALLTRESQSKPVMLIVEDLHWIDSETQALLDGLVESLPSCAMLLLVSYRPEYSHSWGNRTHYSQVRLDPLAPDSANALLTALLGNIPELAPLKHLLMGRTTGNPLFLEESVRTLVETGTLQGEPGAYRLVGDPDTIQIPATVQAIIAERIDRLAPLDKQLLQSASVVGHHVPLPVLERIADQPVADLQRGLSGLQATEFLYQTTLFPELEYTFHHALTHQVAYDSLLQDQRRVLHARVAETMQALYPERRIELAESLAEHYELGECWEQAYTYYLLAAEKGKSKYTYVLASRYAQRGLELAEQIADREAKQVQALVLLGDVASLMGDLDAANSYYDRGRVLTPDARHHQQITNRIHYRHFAARDGDRLAFYVHGRGEETLFLASPSAYLMSLFQPVVEVLCQEFRVVTFDPRGTGASDPIPDQYPIRQRVEDLRAVIETLACGPVIGVGMSQAGSHMTRLVWTYPGLLNKLVLVGTMPGTKAQLGMDLQQMPEERIRQREAIGSGDLSELEDYVNWHAATVFSEPEAHDLAQELIRSALNQPPGVWRNFLAGSALDPDFHIVPLLSDIKIPTLITHGTDDRLVPFAIASYLVEQLPNAQLYAFEGKGHQPVYTAAQEFCEVFRQFVHTGMIPETHSATA